MLQITIIEFQKYLSRFKKYQWKYFYLNVIQLFVLQFFVL